MVKAAAPITLARWNLTSFAYRSVTVVRSSSSATSSIPYPIFPTAARNASTSTSGPTSARAS